jgi:hypothetical protein
MKDSLRALKNRKNRVVKVLKENAIRRVELEVLLTELIVKMSETEANKNVLKMRKTIKRKKITKKIKSRKKAKKRSGENINSTLFHTTVSKRSRTNVVGVAYSEIRTKNGRVICYFIATWCPEKNKQNYKRFRAKNFNDETVFQKAVRFRKKKERELKKLRAQGLR